MSDSILRQVADIKGMPTSRLKARWVELFGSAATAYNRKSMEDRLAYRIQELALGGLRSSTLKRLEALGESLDGGNQAVRQIRTDMIPVPGTRLVREWKGMEHTVTVTQDGFDYQGQAYKSLSPIAKRITGTSWSGLVFFGLKKQAAAK